MKLPLLSPGRSRRHRRRAVRSATLPRILRRFYIAVAFLAAAVAFGTAGFHYGASPQPGWNDSLYMTLITISTVGYGEIVPLDTFAERMFAGTLAISGFGVITFLFTSLSVFFLEADLDETLRRRRMEKAIGKMRGHYIICGFGRVGRNVAGELTATQRPFVAIDSDAARLLSQPEHFPDLQHLVGDASDDDLLLAAGIEDAAGVFAVTGDDSRNLMIALSAKQLNPKVRVVARCHEVRNMPKLRKAGADAIVSPDFTGGMRMASAMVRPQVATFLEEMLRSELNLRIEEVPVPEGGQVRPLGEVKRRGEHFVIMAVRVADAWEFNPADDYLLAPGQIVIAMASPQGRAELARVLQGS